jgi:hypothetical protein
MLILAYPVVPAESVTGAARNTETVIYYATFVAKKSPSSRRFFYSNSPSGHGKITLELHQILDRVKETCIFLVVRWKGVPPVDFEVVKVGEGQKRLLHARHLDEAHIHVLVQEPEDDLLHGPVLGEDLSNVVVVVADLLDDVGDV